MADEKILTDNSFIEESVKKTKEDNKNTDNISKTTKIANKEEDTITLKVQEVIDSNIIINFYGYRVSLDNKGKKIGDVVEVKYNGDRENFKITDYK